MFGRARVLTRPLLQKVSYCSAPVSLSANWMNAKRDAVIANLAEEEAMVELMQSKNQECSGEEAKTAQSLLAIHSLLLALVGQRKLIARIRDSSEGKIDEQPLFAIVDKHSNFLRTLVGASYKVQAGMPIDLRQQLAIELVLHDFPKLSEDALQAYGHGLLIKSVPEEQRPPFIEASLKHIDEQLAELQVERQRIVEIQLDLQKKQRQREYAEQMDAELSEYEKAKKEEFLRKVQGNLKSNL